MGIGDMLGNVVSALRSPAQAIAARITASDQQPPTYTPTADEAIILKRLDIPRRTRDYTLRVFEPMWTKCLLYTAGAQYLDLFPGTQTRWMLKREEWLPQPVLNQIQIKAQRIVDMFTRNRPYCYGVPDDGSEKAKNAVKVGDKVRDYIWIADEWDDQLDDFSNWLITTGNGFARTFVDLSKGYVNKIPRITLTDEPIMDAYGQPIVNPVTGQPVMSKRYVEERDENGDVIYDSIPQGDVTSTIHGPYDITVPLAAPRLERAPWIYHSTMYPVAYLKKCYPSMGRYLSDAGGISTSDLYAHRITSLLASGPAGIMQTLSPYELHGYSTVGIYEEAPTVDFPQGLTVIECNGVPLLIDNKLPVEGRFSYEHAGYFRRPGCFWYRGAVEDALSPQDAINKLEQAMQVNDAFNGNPHVFIPKQSGIRENERIRRKPGGQTLFQYPFKPETDPGTSLSAQVMQRMAAYQQGIEEAMGTRQILLGAAPAGITAGVALDQLGEEAEGVFSPIKKRFERCIERVERTKLELVGKNYTVPRLISYNDSEGNLVEIKDFVGSMLCGNYKVKIQSGSYAPRSISGKKQSAIDMFDRGLLPGVLTNPGERRKFLELQGVSGFEDAGSLDFQRAKWENETLVQSVGWEQIRRMVSDDDAVHLAVHTMLEKSSQYLRLTNETRNRISAHIAEHQIAVLQMQGQTGKDAHTPPGPEPQSMPGGAQSPAMQGPGGQAPPGDQETGDEMVQ